MLEDAFPDLQVFTVEPALSPVIVGGESDRRAVPVSIDIRPPFDVEEEGRAFDFETLEACVGAASRQETAPMDGSPSEAPPAPSGGNCPVLLPEPVIETEVQPVRRAT